MIELLAPAGSEESFYAAVNNGADAVYLGLDLFSARKNAENFTIEKLKEISRTARFFGVKIYCALNTLIKDSELENFERCALAAVEAGADALILQDAFLGKRLKEKYPFLNLHLSTQAGVCNDISAKTAVEFGFSRVIIARETPLDEIRAISSKIETEAFIQGALCTSFSGHCYMSSFIGGNSGNRGLCKQPCRKKYAFYGDNFAEKEGYSLSLSDLMTGKDIFRLIEKGVTSFKIEGRMRRAEYVAAACSYYRAILSGNSGDAQSLIRTYNRGDYTKGLVFEQDNNLISSAVQNHKGELIGKIESVSAHKIFVRSRYKPVKGDGFKIISDEGERGGFTVFCDQIGVGGFYADYNGDVSAGDGVYITTDLRLNKALLSNKRKLPLEIQFTLDEKAKLQLNARNVAVTCEIAAQEAINRPLTKADIAEQILKFSNEAFIVRDTEIDIKGSYFMPKSALNAVRRECVDKLKAVLQAKPTLETEYKQALAWEKINNVQTGEEDMKALAVISNDFDFDLSLVSEAVFTPTDYSKMEEIDNFFAQTKNFSGEKYLYLPPFFTQSDAETIYPYVNRFDGIYSDGLYALEFAKRIRKQLFAGVEFNVFNRIDAQELKKYGVYKFCISKELSRREAAKIEGGYLFSGGSIKVMSLEYCPFGKRCWQCNRKDEFFMRDFAGRIFPVRRYKLGGCRFEIYNPDYLCYFGQAKKRIIDLNAIEKSNRGKIIKNLDKSDELKKLLKNFTFGNLVRGVE